MDYLFGIVVLLCGVVQAGRGAKPKHNVPRLKLSYKGKTSPSNPLPDSGIYGAAAGLSKQPVQPGFAHGCSLRSPFHALFLVWSVFFSLLSSISVYLFLPVSLIHSSILVSKQHLSLCLTSFIPLRRALPSVSRNPLVF